jgi:hypothetical protein
MRREELYLADLIDNARADELRDRYPDVAWRQVSPATARHRPPQRAIAGCRVPSGVRGHADLPHPVLFQHSRADHAGCVRVGPRGCAGSPATISTLALAPAARSVTRYSRSIASDRSRRAAMTGTGTNPDLFTARRGHPRSRVLAVNEPNVNPGAGWDERPGRLKLAQFPGHVQEVIREQRAMGGGCRAMTAIPRPRGGARHGRPRW